MMFTALPRCPSPPADFEFHVSSARKVGLHDEVRSAHTRPLRRAHPPEMRPGNGTPATRHLSFTAWMAGESLRPPCVPPLRAR